MSSSFETSSKEHFVVLIFYFNIEETPFLPLVLPFKTTVAKNTLQLEIQNRSWQYITVPVSVSKSDLN